MWDLGEPGYAAQQTRVGARLGKPLTYDKL
jgi:hypothetical protein